METLLPLINTALLILLLVTSGIVARNLRSRNKLLKQQIENIESARKTESEMVVRTLSNLDTERRLVAAQRELDRSLADKILRLDHPDYFQKLIAIADIEKTKNPAIVSPLRKYVSSPQSGVRLHVFSALAKIQGAQDGENLRILIEHGLCDSSPAIRAHTAQLLGELCESEAAREQLKSLKAIRSLTSACDDEYYCVRKQARWALKQVAPTSTVEPLKQEDRLGQLLAYILIEGPKIDPPTAQKQLSKIRAGRKSGVVEGAVVTGEYDCVVKVIAQDIEALHDIVMREMQGLDWIDVTRTFIVINEPQLYYWHRQKPERVGREVYRAYTLIRVPALSSGGIVTFLSSMTEVVEAAAVYGQTDVIAKLEADDPKKLDEAVMTKIRKIPFVEQTRTYSVREAPPECYWNDTDKFDLLDQYRLKEN